MATRQYFIDDWFWQRCLNSYHSNPEIHCIVKGHFFTKAPDQPTGIRGHGGSLFIIKHFYKFDIEFCRNLWHQGEIPNKYRHILKDDAVFDFERYDLRETFGMTWKEIYDLTQR